jgi:hemerythrin-like domain-containing protein
LFGSLFSSKNQKLVKKWSAEHAQIVTLAHKIIEAYDEGNLKTLKKELAKLNDVAMNHLMVEDIELYKLLKEHDTIDVKTEKLAHDFKESFRGTKLVLMKFLTKYTSEDADLDKEFIETFKSIVGILGERIEFEEKNLYVALSSK